METLKRFWLPLCFERLSSVDGLNYMESVPITTSGRSIVTQDEWQSSSSNERKTWNGHFLSFPSKMWRSIIKHSKCCVCALCCALCIWNHNLLLCFMQPLCFAGRITVDCSNVLLCKDDRCGLGERKTNPGNSSVRVKQCVKVWWMKARPDWFFVYIFYKTCQRS